MKAIGAGTALSVLGGTAAAGGTDADDHAGGLAARQEDDGNTVHEVRTLVRGPPTNPDRPADFFYQPTGLAVQPGDVVRFVFETPDHNVVSYHPAFGMRRRMPTGVGPVSSPLLGWDPRSIGPDHIDPPAEMGGGEGAGGDGGDGNDGGDGSDGGDGPVPDTWLQGFDTPGVYDLLCSPHETYGMAMRVVVGDATEPSFETSNPEALPEPRVGPVGLARATLTDPALQPSNVVEQGTVAWESLEANQSGGSGGE